MSLMGAGLEFFWQDPNRSDLRDSSRAEVYNVFTVDREPVEPVSCPTAKAQNRDILNQNKHRHTRSKIVREKFIDTTERITPPPQKKCNFLPLKQQIIRYTCISIARIFVSSPQDVKRISYRSHLILYLYLRGFLQD